MALFSQKNQPVIDALRHEIAILKRENEHLKDENKRLTDANPSPAAGMPAVQMRRCVNCKRDLPDGPIYYPGYLEPMGANSADEARRHHCIHCR